MALDPAPILSMAEAQAWAEAQRHAGKDVVLTNGVFDLLHAGHVTYLDAARRLGDVLVVGLNSDAGARALKGPTRPLVAQEDRATLLAHLRSVDCVVIFDQLTASDLVRSLRPDVYVKGGDYDLASLPEAEAAQAVGAQVCFVPTVEGRSTTSLVARILRQGA